MVLVRVAVLVPDLAAASVRARAVDMVPGKEEAWAAACSTGVAA